MEAWQFDNLRYPMALWLALTIPMGLFLLRRTLLQQPVVRIAAPFSLERFAVRRALLALTANALAFLGGGVWVLAIAQPQRQVPLPVTQAGIDIMLLLDRSSSMAELDLDPTRSRWQIAQQSAASFVTERSQDRIGLLGFARYADLHSPTTLDHVSLIDLLESMRMVELGGFEDLTGIGGAVGYAAQILGRRDTASRVIVLLTDGQENVATPAEPASLRPMEAAALCREWGVRVYCIALAQEAGAELQDLAQRTGGRSYSASTQESLTSIFSAIDQLERQAFHPPGMRDESRAQPWIWLGWTLLLVAWQLRRWGGRSLP